MPKVSHGSARHGATKKKARRQPEPASEARTLRPAPEAAAPVQPAESVTPGSAESALRFRPKDAGSRSARPAGQRVAASAKAAQQAIDYGYVYTDLRIIGGLSVLLFGAMGAVYVFLR